MSVHLKIASNSVQKPVVKEENKANGAVVSRLTDLRLKKLGDALHKDTTKTVVATKTIVTDAPNTARMAKVESLPAGVKTEEADYFKKLCPTAKTQMIAGELHYIAQKVVVTGGMTVVKAVPVKASKINAIVQEAQKSGSKDIGAHLRAQMEKMGLKIQS